MNGLMMDYELTIPAIMRYAEPLFGAQTIVSRLEDRSFHRYSYAECFRRTKQLSVALEGLGIGPGDRVATLCWNHYQHLEAYFAIPAAGAVLHTLNLRLHPDDLAYILNHAEDRVLLVDASLLPLVEQFRDRVHLRHVVVIGPSEHLPEGMLSYEDVVAGGDHAAFSYREIDEHAAAAMCYTSGTTGRPKGVLFSHRSLVIHSMVEAMANTLAVAESDVIMPVVPMFHANAWGLPYTGVLAGAKQVFPGPLVDPVSLLENIEQERVTLTAGVPTVWLGVLQVLDKQPDRFKVGTIRSIMCGGSAAPKAMIDAYDQSYGLHVTHAWGMTEMAPLGTLGTIANPLRDAPPEEQANYRALAGRAIAFVELRARGSDGLVPWDGTSMGELEVRGPAVASAYYNSEEADTKWTDDGWFRTGDIVSIDNYGYIKIQDRAKDLIKSGGEWISSVDLENTLMGHPAVSEAAVIAVPDPKWQERPLAVVVPKEGHSVTEDELLAFLAPHFAKWWLPDHVEFVEAIPRTGTGKFLKTALRERFRNYVADGQG